MERHWGVLKPVLDPTRDEVYQFADAMVSELAAIFPDPYLHIGGDEVDDSQWKASPAIQAFMRDNRLADSHALQAYFNRKLETILEKHHRQMVGWDEIYHPVAAEKHSDRHSILAGAGRAGRQVAQNGYQGILSTGFYLDQPQSTAYHYRNEILPQPLGIETAVQPGEQAQSWAFTMPRLKGKRGGGELHAGRKGKQGWRGFIDFAGKSRRAVQDIVWRTPQQVTFRVDTWMGDTRPVFTLQQDKLSGYTLVGNVRYPTRGDKLAAVPAGKMPVVPDVAKGRPTCSAAKRRCGRKTWGRRCWISACGRAPLRWQSGCGRRRTSPMSKATCTAACRRWTPGRRCRSGCSSIRGNGARIHPAEQQRADPAAADPRPGGGAGAVLHPPAPEVPGRKLSSVRAAQPLCGCADRRRAARCATCMPRSRPC